MGIKKTQLGTAIGESTSPVDLLKQGTPLTVSNKSRLYSKDVSGVAEFFVKDDAGNEVQVTSNGSIPAGYATIQNEGTPLTQETVVDFQGAGVTASAGSGKTVVTIPGGSGTQLYGFPPIAVYGHVNTSATVGCGYVHDGLSGQGTLTLPASPADTNEVGFTVQCCSLIINGNGKTLRWYNGSCGICTIGASSHAHVLRYSSTRDRWEYVTGNLS